MGTAAGVLGVFGAITQAYGQIKAGQDAKKIANYNARAVEAQSQAELQAAEVAAQQHERNAVILGQDALIAREAQAYRDARTVEQQARVRSATRAIVAASGLELSGSPLALYEETVRQQAYDRLAQQYESDLRLRAVDDAVVQEGYAAEVARYGGAERVRVGGVQAELLRASGEQAATAGLLQAGGTLAKGAGQAYVQYQQGLTLHEQTGTQDTSSWWNALFQLKK